LIEDGVNRIVIDYGTKVSDTPPSFPLEIKRRITSTFLSHCHLDHGGALPALIKNNTLNVIYFTKVTKELTELLLRDSIK
jgi:Cft2 family RNA processing exonuclease